MRRRRRTAGAASLEAGGVASGPPLQWVEAVIEEGNAAAGRGGALSVQLPGGARLQISDARQTALAARLLQALAREAAC